MSICFKAVGTSQKTVPITMTTCDPKGPSALDGEDGSGSQGHIDLVFESNGGDVTFQAAVFDDEELEGKEWDGGRVALAAIWVGAQLGMCLCWRLPEGGSCQSWQWRGSL